MKDWGGRIGGGWDEIGGWDRRTCLLETKNGLGIFLGQA